MEPHAATLKILDRLIGFPTVSADSNLGLIGYAEGLLQDAGFHTQRMPNTEGGKAGLVARLGADGPGACCCPPTAMWCGRGADMDPPSVPSDPGRGPAVRARHDRYEGLSGRDVVGGGARGKYLAAADAGDLL